MRNRALFMLVCAWLCTVAGAVLVSVGLALLWGPAAVMLFVGACAMALGLVVIPT